MKRNRNENKTNEEKKSENHRVCEIRSVSSMQEVGPGLGLCYY